MTTRDKVIQVLRDFDWSGVGAVDILDLQSEGNAEWAQILADQICAAIDDQPFHVLDVGEQGWTLKHPLDCRDELFECPYNRAAEALDGPPAAPGRYRVGDDGRGNLVIEQAVTT